MVVKVIDDVVSKGYQNLIENTISSDNFDWNYITGLTFDDDSYTGFVKRIFFKETIRINVFYASKFSCKIYS